MAKIKYLKNRIILASSSPRRKELLKVLLSNFGLKFVVKPANITEYIPKKAVNFAKFVSDLAFQKAANVAKKHKGLVIGADTIVVFKGGILGKPKNEKDAVRMLKLLSGNEHRVYTGLAMIDMSRQMIYCTHELTYVRFRILTEKEIRFYAASGSPLDKAGGYGIQDDFGSTFVERIRGDYFNVVGLPILKTYLGLDKFIGLMN
ncbi:MAG: Maf family protein [Ignavibacteria bacterium]